MIYCKNAFHISKYLIICLILSLFMFQASAQPAKTEHQQIKQLLQDFTSALEVGDSTKMFSLFGDVPVTWVGVYQPATQASRLSINPASSDFKVSDHKTWFRSVMTGAKKEERFKNVEIIEDGSIATIIFDYSFWAGGKRGNWGKESWGLIKTNGNWKIVSVIFSIESEKVRPGPK